MPEAIPAASLTPSFIANQATISRTWQDGGIYGRFLNESRLGAWRFAIERFDLDQSSIVDVGCSYGSWAENWRALGFGALKGIDPNPDVIERARAAFHEVHQAYAWDLRRHFPNSPTIAANGVLVHILEDDQSVAFLRDVGACLSRTGHFLFSVINASYYYSSGRKASRGPNSCTRALETVRGFASQAGLEIVGEIGTFIDPWAIPDLEYLAQEQELRGRWELYQPFIDLARTLRGLSTSPFSEVLFVTRRQS